ncbi:MAG: hypothetical protein ACRETP_06615, partial [Steroidobacteraceae bacterium]
HPILLDHQPIHGATAGVSYEFGRYALSGDALYSSGLATGFADCARSICQSDAVAAVTAVERFFCPFYNSLDGLPFDFRPKIRIA